MIEANSHECSSCGFWPGGGAVAGPAFYAQRPVGPAGAYYNTDLHEFVMPYEAVRSADDPDATLLQFLQSTYDAAADLGRWDRMALERTALPGTAGEA
jgi:hypothetical protein